MLIKEHSEQKNWVAAAAAQIAQFAELTQSYNIDRCDELDKTAQCHLFAQ